VLHKWIDGGLNAIAAYGPLSYGILFLIVFVETGVVIFPFLPGDSLLFTVGAFCAKGVFRAEIAAPLLIAAALLGDNCNYFLGKKFGRAAFSKDSSRVFNRSNLLKTEAFFTKHGGKAVILARFVPIVRTFAPFVAGMGAMPYRRFLGYSVVGALLWVGICVGAGIVFGNIPFVQKNFEIVIVGVVAVSLLPMAIEYLNHRRASK
jgi:membrane-associated protein